MSESTKCHKCGRTDIPLIHHHKSYNPEIIVMVCRSCHQLLHKKLRASGKCNVPADELRRISNNSKHRLKRIIKYSKTERGKKVHNRATKKYAEVHNRFNWFFYEKMMSHVQLRELITIYDRGRIVGFSSGFYATNGLKIMYIEVK